MTRATPFQGGHIPLPIRFSIEASRCGRFLTSGVGEETSEPQISAWKSKLRRAYEGKLDNDSRSEPTPPTGVAGINYKRALDINEEIRDEILEPHIVSSNVLAADI
jgi:hypothetical protein